MDVIGKEKIPAHLPPRLAICMWGWYWLTYVDKGEPYADLERAVIETKERNFNCLRVDVAPYWCFDRNGHRRGPIELGPWVPGASRNNRCLAYRGNVRYDVYERVMRLFELAEKHDLYLALTSWHFQESTSLPTDPAVRDEVIEMSTTSWFMPMAEGMDRLIRDVKLKKLAHRIAFVEVHNELNWTPFSNEEKRSRTEAAIAYLKQRHPELLISADYAWIEPAVLAGNTDLIDHHVYATKTSVAKFFCMAYWDVDKGPNMNDELLKWILRPDPEPWKDFLARANVNAFIHSSWLSRTWMYANLDNNRFDYWCFKNFGAEVDEATENVIQKIKEGAALGRERNLPVGVDEGYNLYPPLRSRFEESAAGRWITQNAVHTAIEEGYWGMLPTGYFKPDEPAWLEEPQRTYMTELNEHILTGEVKRLLGPDKER